jgi:alkylation response protein AidB-like acyl-CoA dehydrogenase
VSAQADERPGGPADPAGFTGLAAEAHAFFAARVPRRQRAVHRWGEGPDAVMGVATATGDEEEAEVARAQEWQRELFDAGLAWVDGPAEYGGRGLSADHAALVRRISAEYELPNTGALMVSFQIVGPSILAHGTEDQKRTWLPPIWRGEVICCQLFSEPEAGSDLASLRMAATRDGDEWVINGQKVWSSGAHYSQLGEVLVRTGTPADRHRGITAFLVEMDRPEVDVRPLRQITGTVHFNEVFLDNVRLPDSNRLGPLNEGWRVAQTALGGERSLMSDEDNGILRDPIRKLFALARHVGLADDEAVQELLAEAWARDQLLHVTGSRLSGSDAPPGSVAKLQMVANTEFYIAVATRLLGHQLIADTGEWGTFAWTEVLLGAPAHRIAGGSDEIQRNIIAERVLGLPREPRPTAKDHA